MNEKKINFAVSKIEYLLAEMYEKKSVLYDKILTSDELIEYLNWLITTYKSEVHFSISDLQLIPCSERMNQIAIELLQNPKNEDVCKELFSMYGPQFEKDFFNIETDISVTKQIRFMPSYWHSNNYFEFYYNEGNTDIRISFPEEKITIKKGTILLISPSAVHACQALGYDDNLLCYMIRKSTFKTVFWNQLPQDSLMARFFQQVINGGSTTSYIQFETGDDVETEELLSLIYNESQNNKPYKGKLLNSLMTTFFIVLLRKFENTVKMPRTHDFYWSERFSALLSYIETNYATVTLSFLSQKFFYSEKQISRIISKYVGTSYNQLILDLKMKRAAFLLQEENAQIEQIAEQVGYSTTSSFYRAFSSYYQATPAEFRSKQKAINKDV